MLQETILILLICGATGAFLKDILNDGCIEIPYLKNGKLYLGFFGGLLIGAAAGYFVDNNPTTAFLGGYAGSSVITNLIFKNTNKKSSVDNSV